MEGSQVNDKANPRNDNAFRQYLSDAANFWEKERPAYNLVLLGVVVAWFALTWPHFRQSLNFTNFITLTLLGLMANICYSGAYLIDIPLQYTSLKDRWRNYRRLLWFLGLLWAVIVTNYWIADEIYPYVD